jgi:predicted transcriptional regulator
MTAKRKYPPDPVMEALERVMNTRDKYKARIAELEQQLAEKDERIKELEELADLVNKHRKDRMIVDKEAAWNRALELIKTRRKK